MTQYEELEDQRGDQARDEKQRDFYRPQAGNPRNDMYGAGDRPAGSRPQMIATVGQDNAEINYREYAVIGRLAVERDLSTRLIPFAWWMQLTTGGRRIISCFRRRRGYYFSRADLNLPMEKHASFVRVEEAR